MVIESRLARLKDMIQSPLVEGIMESSECMSGMVMNGIKSVIISPGKMILTHSAVVTPLVMV